MQEAGGMGAARPGYGRGGMGVVRAYALIFGIVYAAVALLELILGDDGLEIGGAQILQLEPLQNAVHWIIAVVVLGSFFAGENAARMVARIVGIVLVVLAIYGFVAPDSLGDLLGYEGDIPAAYNWIHLLSGLVALFAGFFASRTYASRPAAA
ncbi:MAG TPA: DUF4383 domain-containing protein [Actinomycetota bacterium]|nr:DUF4383 domain-containing protein [Actinomycetota bacterium]